MRRTEARIGLGPLLGEAAPRKSARCLPRRQLDELRLEPARPHEQRELLASRPRDQLLDVRQERMHGLARRSLRGRVYCQRRQLSTRLLERVAAAPEQPWLEALL